STTRIRAALPAVLAVPSAVPIAAPSSGLSLALVVLAVAGLIARRVVRRLLGLRRCGGFRLRLRGRGRGGLARLLGGGRLRPGGDHDRDRGAAVDLLVRAGLGADHAALLDAVGVLLGGGVAEARLGARVPGVRERLTGDVRDGDGAVGGRDDELDRRADRLGAVAGRRLLEHRAGLVLAVGPLGDVDLEADVLQRRGGAVDVRAPHIGHREAAGRVPDLDGVAALGRGAGRGLRAGDDPALGLLLVLAVDVLGFETGVLERRLGVLARHVGDVGDVRR